MTDSSQLVYLAGPIDGVNADDPSHTVRMNLRKTLEAQGHCVYDPYHAYLQTTVIHHAAAVCRINRNAIAMCDGMIAYLVGAGRGFGTTREIEWAKSCNKPVILLTDFEVHSLEAYDLLVLHYSEFVDKPFHLDSLFSGQQRKPNAE